MIKSSSREHLGLPENACERHEVETIAWLKFTQAFNVLVRLNSIVTKAPFAIGMLAVVRFVVLVYIAPSPLVFSSLAETITSAVLPEFLI